MPLDVDAILRFEASDQRAQSAIFKFDQLVAIRADNVMVMPAGHQHIVDCRSALYACPHDAKLDEQIRPDLAGNKARLRQRNP